MKAAVLETLNKLLVVHNDWPDPKCGPQDAIVQVEANGICRSDWHIWVGDWGWIGLQPQLPQVIGHEFCGVLEEVGPQVRKFKKGTVWSARSTLAAVPASTAYPATRTPVPTLRLRASITVAAMDGWPRFRGLI